MAGGRAGLNPRRGIEHDAAGLTGDAGPACFMNATANETLVFILFSFYKAIYMGFDRKM